MNEGGIFLIQDDGALVEMRETAYDSEDLLQDLLARYPNILAGEQMNPTAPRKWLLIKREYGVPDDEGAGNRWSVDHLFLDQDGIPTLVEVKRSTDTRIRREVVGQMLDYAANAVVYWPAEAIQSQFEAREQGLGHDPALTISAFLAGASEEHFWLQVKTNLQAGRVRMVFVADAIPPELKRVVEFMNTQMDPAEVLAVEIRQYIGATGRTLVPRVIGQTAEAQQKKAGPSSSGRKRLWTAKDFFSELAGRKSAADADVARKVESWADVCGLSVSWGGGPVVGSLVVSMELAGTVHRLFCIWSDGNVEILFATYRPPLSNPPLKKQIFDDLNNITGVNLSEDSITRRPNIGLNVLATESSLGAFFAVWERVRNGLT